MCNTTDGILIAKVNFHPRVLASIRYIQVEIFYFATIQLATRAACRRKSCTLTITPKRVLCSATMIQGNSICRNVSGTWFQCHFFFRKMALFPVSHPNPSPHLWLQPTCVFSDFKTLVVSFCVKIRFFTPICFYF